MNTNITAALGYLCHLPSESTNVTKVKATKNEAILPNKKVRCYNTDEGLLCAVDLRPEE